MRAFFDRPPAGGWQSRNHNPRAQKCTLRVNLPGNIQGTNVFGHLELLGSILACELSELSDRSSSTAGSHAPGSRAACSHARRINPRVNLPMAPG